jgi:hypothetical protein
MQTTTTTGFDIGRSTSRERSDVAVMTEEAIGRDCRRLFVLYCPPRKSHAAANVEFSCLETG